MAAMWGKYKKLWMQNFTKDFGNRTGLVACLYAFYLSVVNFGIIVVWFVSLLCLTWLAVHFDLLLPNEAAPVAIMIMNVMALTHLCVFSYSKFCGKAVTILANKLEHVVRQVVMLYLPNFGLPKKIKFSDYFESVLSHIPPVPCAPPRAHLV
jgi:hypothetical protein